MDTKNTIKLHFFLVGNFLKKNLNTRDTHTKYIRIDFVKN